MIGPPTIAPVPEGTDRPLWSVMIPTWNCARYLRRTLESVLGQDPGPGRMQIEVVDDCSTADDPEDVVAELGRGRIGFFRKPRNEGPTPTFNVCLPRARGHLVHLLHGDDYVLPDFYATVATAAERHPDVDFFATRALVVDEHDALDTISTRVPSLERGGRDTRPFYYDNPFRTPAVVVRRTRYERVGGFDPRLVHVADWEMWVRAIRTGGGLAINEPRCAYRVFAGNHTSQLVRTGEGLRDHLRMAAVWEAAGLPEFSRARFRRWIVTTARLRMQHFAETGDHEAACANRRLWSEIAAPREKLAYAAHRTLRWVLRHAGGR